VADDDLTGPEKKEVAGRRSARGEHRVPPAIAVIVAALTYALLPSDLLLAPRYVIPALEAVLLVALVVTNPKRLTRQTRWSRIASIAQSTLVIGTNMVALGMLVHALTKSSTPGGPLLVAAMQVWVTNVIGFALLYWELDRGGPVARWSVPRSRMQAADWRFSQDENDDAVIEVATSASSTSGWIPTFIDYLYVSLTNSSAFSPTDTMPLSTRAKVLMGIQATAALLTSLLVIARAVGSLS
jgi:hypothetical protein